MKAHKTVPVIIRGQSVEIDKGIRSIAELMNEIPEVETFNSCEGGPDHACVQFGGECAFPLLPQLAQAILKEEKLWRKNHRHVCHGCRGMSVRLEIDGRGIVLRWQPYDYHRMLKIFKSLKRTTRKPV
jgi:hypothetical protein